MTWEPVYTMFIQDVLPEILFGNFLATFCNHVHSNFGSDRYLAYIAVTILQCIYLNILVPVLYHISLYNGWIFIIIFFNLDLLQRSNSVPFTELKSIQLILFDSVFVFSWKYILELTPQL